MPSKYPSTLLPSRMEVVEMRKAVLDLLRKINAEAQYAYDHGLGLWLPDYALKRMLLTPGWGLYLDGPAHEFESNMPAAGLASEVVLSLEDELRFFRYISSAGAGANFVGYHARGSRDTPLQTLTNDVLSGIFGSGHDGTAFSTVLNAAIRLVAAEAVTALARGTYIDFATTTIGATTRAVRMRLTDAGRLGIGVTAPQAQIETVAPVGVESARFGDGTNRSAFERDGTLRFDGTATVYNDIYASLDPKTTGAGKPTLRAFNGNINAYTMAVNDISELDACELLHDWKEGTAIELHVHWASRGVDATARGVKWQIDYTWANMLPAGAPTAFPAVQTPSAETQIPANTPDKTHFYTSVVSFTPVGGKIGANVMMSLKRIASVVNAAPTNDPWIMMVGIHYEIDTVGSRSISSK